jgi:hypothetical protein
MALTVASVESAIELLIAGNQSASVDGVSYSKASLPALWEARKQLKLEAARTTRPTMRAFGFNNTAYADAENGTDAEVKYTTAVTP